MLKILFVPINPAGWPFVVLFALITLGLCWVWEWLFLPGVVLTLWCLWFFRDPVRVTPTRTGLILSPADGVVQLIDEAAPPAELGMDDAPLYRVCVFMNVFNVHVNRSPVGGIFRKIVYRPGKFLNASLDKASADNERLSYRVEMDNGMDLAFVQIAGLVARRIVRQTQENQALEAGQRIGLIRFGSRVDVYLPKGVMPQVMVGQSMVAGESIIADIQSKEKSMRVGNVQ